MFRDEESNLLAKLHLKLPSPTIDRQVNHVSCFILHDEKNWIFYCSSTTQQKDNWRSSDVDWAASHHAFPTTKQPTSYPPSTPSYPPKTFIP